MRGPSGAQVKITCRAAHGRPTMSGRPVDRGSQVAVIELSITQIADCMSQVMRVTRDWEYSALLIDISQLRLLPVTRASCSPWWIQGRPRMKAQLSILQQQHSISRSVFDPESIYSQRVWLPSNKLPTSGCVLGLNRQVLICISFLVRAGLNYHFCSKAWILLIIIIGAAQRAAHHEKKHFARRSRQSCSRPPIQLLANLYLIGPLPDPGERRDNQHLLFVLALGARSSELGLTSIEEIPAPIGSV